MAFINLKRGAVRQYEDGEKKTIADGGNILINMDAVLSVEEKTEQGNDNLRPYVDRYCLVTLSGLPALRVPADYNKLASAIVNVFISQTKNEINVPRTNEKH